MKEQNDIEIFYYERIPDNTFLEFKDLSKKTGINLFIKKTSPGIFGALEWAVPTAIAVYILKPYFETILKEAAKDHYAILKKGFNSLISKTLKNKDKVKLSSILSFYFPVKEDSSIKFCLIEGTDVNEYENQVDKMVELMYDHFKNYPNDELTKKITSLTTNNTKSFYAFFDPISNQWELIDTFAEALNSVIERKKQNK